MPGTLEWRFLSSEIYGSYWTESQANGHHEFTM
jgi:hypothetical protein